MKEPVHVVLAADENYRNGLEVTKRSMLAATRQPERLVFHLFGPRDLEGLDVSDFGGWNNGSKMTYLRLFLPELLPEVPRAVYSDVDVIWNRDVAELYDFVQDDCARAEKSVCWVRDFDSTARGRPNYGCAGVAVFNLGKLRSFGLSEKARAYVRANGTPRFVDQDLINHFIGSDAALLPCEWNVMGNWRALPSPGAACVWHITGIGLHFRDAPIAWPPQDVLWFRVAWKLGVVSEGLPWRRPWGFAAIRLLALAWPLRALLMRVLHGRLRERVIQHLYFSKEVMSWSK